MRHTVCHECRGTGYTTFLRCSIARQRASVGPYTVMVWRVGSCDETPRPCTRCLHGKLPGIVAPV